MATARKKHIRITPEQRRLLVELVRASDGVPAARILATFTMRTGARVAIDAIYRVRAQLRGTRARPRSAAAASPLCANCGVVPGVYPALPWGFESGQICKGCQEAIAEERQEARWRETIDRFYKARARRLQTG